MAQIDAGSLRDFEVFAGLSVAELESILALAAVEHFKADDVILEESNAGASGFYIIVRGMVKVEIEVSNALTGEKGNRRLATLKTGEVFGERGLLSGRRRSARVVAYSDLVALRIDNLALEQEFERNPRLGWLFMRNLTAILSDRLVGLNFMLRDEI
ncbi:MAG: hypothetical protein A2521_10705 [Deltaproteobacteria bacterium RIFOXYD12_FULL_57_12]|nr:MAG: hypothetical protein A2521_10705 [Deltaproteobacteria bacterium RIFOXYD12_FULL_57_12]